MKYQVDKKALLALLIDRPALITRVSNLNEKFVLESFRSFQECGYGKAADLYTHTPMELRTKAVTQMYLEKTSSGRWGGFSLDPIPQEILEGLTAKQRDFILRKKGPEFIEALPNPTHAEWLVALEEGFCNMAKIPASVWGKDAVYAIVTAHKVCYKQDEDGEKFKEMAALYWDAALALKCVDADKDVFNSLPGYVITYDVLASAMTADSNAYYGRHGLQITNDNIPEEVWDESVAMAALECTASNIRFIPKKIVTEEMCIKAAKQGLWKELPIKTYKCLVAMVAVSIHKDDQPIIKKLVKDRTQFIIDVIAIGGASRCGHLKTLGFDITEDTYLEALKCDLGNFQYIDKASQTEKIIDAFIYGADSTLIDQCSENINLGKLKAHHTPFLLNCHRIKMQEVCNKYLRGDNNQVSSNTVEIDMAPGEYATVRNRLSPRK